EGPCRARRYAERRGAGIGGDCESQGGYSRRRLDQEERLNPCRMAAKPSQAAGTASSSTEKTSRQRSPRSGRLKWPFRNAIVSGPGGSEILLDDPSGNPVELFQAAR